MRHGANATIPEFRGGVLAPGDSGYEGAGRGGGLGWLMRKLGSTADNVIAADVVSADSRRMRASTKDDAELLFGLRGGGGNFGVVTRFELALHEIGTTLLAGPIVWAMEDAPEVMRFYRDFAREAPDELTTIVQYRTLPPFPVFPPQFHGRKVLQIAAVWAGRISDGECALEPLRACGKPLFDLVSPRPYLAHQSANDKALLRGWHYYWKSTEFEQLEDETIDVLTEYSLAMHSPRSFTV